MRVVGIDPSTLVTGYGCVEGHDGRTLIEAGVVRASGQETLAKRLVTISADVRELLARLSPDVVAMETMFSNPTHPGTVVKMAHARGVLLLAAAESGARIVEIRPAEAKRAMVGHGAGSKAQMQRAVQTYYDLAEPPSPPDIADALAIAITAAHRVSSDPAGRVIDPLGR